jgi:hypothetical protein
MQPLFQSILPFGFVEYAEGTQTDPHPTRSDGRAQVIDSLECESTSFGDRPAVFVIALVHYISAPNYDYSGGDAYRCCDETGQTNTHFLRGSRFRRNPPILL